MTAGTFPAAQSPRPESNQTVAEFVLITPAKNEAVTLPTTIASVVRQSVLPLEWVIVSDGSTDGTDEIVRNAAQTNPWIRLVTLPPRPGRDFAAVVRATETGLKALTVSTHRFIGLLDADVRLPANYFAEVLHAFAQSPRLGLAGGMAVDVGLRRDRLPRNRLDVPGATQFFRRECFEQLGGLIAIPEGGWDALTCARARMVGYETRLLTDLIVDHLKPRNVSEGGRIRRTWQLGVRDYALGYGPLFISLKSMGRIAEKPVIVASVARWLGYCCAGIRGQPRIVPVKLVRHVRREHRQRILAHFHLKFRRTTVVEPDGSFAAERVSPR